MTQAAVSYQVKSLEERLGAPLFLREKGRARLTPLGLRLVPALSAAFDAIETAFASHREEDESLLTITTTHTFANTWLAWRLGAFQMDHPDLAVRMTTSNELCDVRGGDADVAVRAGRGGWEGWRNTIVRLLLHPDGQSGMPHACREQAWPQASAGRPAAPEPHQSDRRMVAAWFADNGVPADEAVIAGRVSGWKTRPTKAMRRWRGRASRR